MIGSPTINQKQLVAVKSEVAKNSSFTAPETAMSFFQQYQTQIITAVLILLIIITIIVFLKMK